MGRFSDWLKIRQLAEADVIQTRDNIRNPPDPKFAQTKARYGTIGPSFNYPMRDRKTKEIVQASGQELGRNTSGGQPFMGVHSNDMKQGVESPSKRTYGVESDVKRPIFGVSEDLKAAMLFWAKSNEKSRQGKEYIAMEGDPDGQETKQVQQIINAMRGTHAQQFAMAYQHQLNDIFRWSDGHDTMPNEKVYKYDPEAEYGSLGSKATSSKYEPHSPYHGMPQFGNNE